MFEHGRTMKDETESGEVRKNRVRESDGRNCIELRITQMWSAIEGNYKLAGFGPTRGSFLYQ